MQFTGIRDDVYELLPGFDVFDLDLALRRSADLAARGDGHGDPERRHPRRGIPEVVSDGVEGFLVLPATRRDRAALTKLLDDPALRLTMGTAAAVRARAFDLRSAQ